MPGRVVCSNRYVTTRVSSSPSPACQPSDENVGHIVEACTGVIRCTPRWSGNLDGHPDAGSVEMYARIAASYRECAGRSLIHAIVRLALLKCSCPFVARVVFGPLLLGHAPPDGCLTNAAPRSSGYPRAAS